MDLHVFFTSGCSRYRNFMLDQSRHHTAGSLVYSWRKELPLQVKNLGIAPNLVQCCEHTAILSVCHGFGMLASPVCAQIDDANLLLADDFSNPAAMIFSCLMCIPAWLVQCVVCVGILCTCSVNLMAPWCCLYVDRGT